MSDAPVPQNIEAEQALLGAILINNDAMLHCGSLDASHFVEPIHGQMFADMRAVIQGGRRVTPLTMKDFVGDGPLVGSMTGIQYLARLAVEATTVVNAPDFVAEIIDTATRRRLIDLAGTIGQMARESRADVTALDLVERAEGDLLSLRQGAGAEASSVALGAVADRLLAQARAPQDAAPVPRTGLTDVDRALAKGLRPHRLTVLAGRPGMGKTQLGIGLARRLARQGWGVAFFSLELDEEEMGARLLASEIAAAVSSWSDAVAYRDILTSDLDERGLSRLETATGRVRDLPIEMVTRAGLSAGQIEARTKVIKAKLAARGVTLAAVVVDYLSLVEPNSRYKGNKVDEFGEIARHLREMAKRLSLHVVLLAQLNRQVESRDDKRPQMSDLRASGEIEEHADAVGLLYRPAYYDAKDPRGRKGDTDFSNQAIDRQYDLIVDFGKNRLGPTVEVKLFCHIASGLIDNATRF